jgi:hypothetical protein
MMIAAAALAAVSAPAVAQQAVTTIESGALASAHDGTAFTASSAELSQNRPGGVGTSSASITRTRR